MKAKQLRNAAILSALFATSVGCGNDERARPSVIACGVLGGADADSGRVWGWAQVVDAPPASIRIEVDGAVAATAIASQERSDLVEKGVHPTGEAGFVAWVDTLTSTSEVRAFIDVEELELELTRSPLDVAASGSAEPPAPTPPPSEPEPTVATGADRCNADAWTDL